MYNLHNPYIHIFARNLLFAKLLSNTFFHDSFRLNRYLKILCEAPGTYFSLFSFFPRTLLSEFPVHFYSLLIKVLMLSYQKQIAGKFHYLSWIIFHHNPYTFSKILQPKYFPTKIFHPHNPKQDMF